MEKKKNKKKLFAIIGGSVLAFVLTIALSVSITLAYFGATQSGNTTIVMGGPVNVGATVIDTAEKAGILPGEKVELNAQAVVSSVSTTSNPTNAFLRAKFTWSVTDGAEIASPNLNGTKTTVNGTENAGTWVKNGDFYYLTDGAGKMLVIDLANATDYTQTIILVSDYTVDRTLTNDVADKTITITVEFTAIQAELPVGADGAMTSDVTMAQACEAFNTIANASQDTITA